MRLEDDAVISALHLAHVNTLSQPRFVASGETVLGDLDFVKEQWSVLECWVDGGVASFGAVDVEQRPPVDIALWNGADALGLTTGSFEGVDIILVVTCNAEFVGAIFVNIYYCIPECLVLSLLALIELLNYVGQVALHDFWHLRLSYSSAAGN